MVLASVLLSHRLTGPMRRFADAADRVGRGRRTPLTSARLRAHLVDETRLRTRLLGDLDRLEAITESALDVVRGLAEEPAVRIDPHALLGEIAADRREAGGDASLAPVDAPPLVACRPVMLRRAVTNLVGAAASPLADLGGPQLIDERPRLPRRPSQGS